ncbi:UDP-N-acetylmuramoylalanyl-D-glutamate-2,6-diaminopimelate ligase MurE domain protein [Mycobacterium ulcerans str. Harvey]|uniref:UDP-N-acetylmuramoylalanyl-D-glutamate-2, 6-diaminopimelate ligase MurE domain protein n=1 Tax=Mycobacterium ulcerans str. Harvey TaxID=1299332 RepID=A0ABN0QT38_MYCUL|nr:UDP-N-acetylmuramoylalanyl-D-glutamate-2,6-diaminopimelate ligase MurE domain protein [Mycobacterium ulcerans str. Harvey]
MVSEVESVLRPSAGPGVPLAELAVQVGAVLADGPHRAAAVRTR